MVQVENMSYLLRTMRRDGRQTQGEGESRREKAGRDN